MWSLTSDRAPWELFLIGAFWFFCLWTLGFFHVSNLRRPALASCARLLVATLLCWCLTAPRLTRQVETSAPITILLDDSASLKRRLDDGATVWERAVELARVLEESARKRDVPTTVRTLGGATLRDVDEATKLTPKAPYSPLNDAATCADASRVFFVSDGIEHAEGATSEKSSAKVDATVLGSTRPALDWRLEDVAASGVVYRNERARLHATAKFVGDSSASRRCSVRLWERRANESEPHEIWNDSFEASRDGILTFDHEWEPDRENIASYRLVVVVDEDDANRPGDAFRLDALSECCVLNNVASFDVEPRDRKLRVLLIDDYARNEYRYLRELLRREEKIELQTILFSEDERVRAEDPLNLPFERLDRKTLESFDVLIVGDVPKERWQGKEERLLSVILREGATTSIWFAGNANPPDERLAPGDVANCDPQTLCGETEYWRPDATNAGRRVYGDLLDACDEIEWSRVTPNVAPNASSEILLTARRAEEETPVVIAASLGSNRVLWQGVDEIWRLQTLADKSIYRQFVLRTLDYLTSGRTRPTSEANGTTSAELFDLTNVEDKQALIQEETNVEARAEKLEKIAASTGGETLDLRDVDEKEAARRARMFFERRLDEAPKAPVEKRIDLATFNVVVPALFLLFFLAWTLDVKRFVTIRKKNNRSQATACQRLSKKHDVE